MTTELLLLGLAAWLLAGVLALAGVGARARVLLGIGGLAVLLAALVALPAATPPLATPIGMGSSDSIFTLTPDALWLMGFGLPGAILACWLGPPAGRQRSWIFGAVLSLIGALGVFGLQDAVGFLIAWEVMSLGGAVMILGEDAAAETGRPVLFMLALLEAGTVALIVAFILLAAGSGSIDFAGFAAAARAMPEWERLGVGLLLLIGFGAKLGLLPFYEWFPGAYGAASGATGAMMSGIVMNAAFFGLGRSFVAWLPASPGTSYSIAGIFVVAVGVISAILTALYAFQQERWRTLLSLSSAENGSISVCLLGIAVMFRQDGLMDLAGLAWTVALLHLAGHALAKGAMFLTADGVQRTAGDDRLVQRGILARSSWIFGIGALFAAMSLAAMPPQAGFVSEWYLFQTFFQGFHFGGLGNRFVAALGGAGLAITAAIALATYIKAFGIGLLGRRPAETGANEGVPFANAAAVGVLGLCVLALAVGMPVWLRGLEPVVRAAFGVDAAAQLHDGWLLVPLTAKFAFISPSKLIIAMPLLALLPLGLLAFTMRRGRRTVPVWYGGRDRDAGAATTALTFSNALRTFYSFVYRPNIVTEREQSPGANGLPYFVRRLTFRHDVAPIFGPYLFAPLERLVVGLAARLRVIQSGRLNVYLALVGALFVLVLLAAFLLTPVS